MRAPAANTRPFPPILPFCLAGVVMLAGCDADRIGELGARVRQLEAHQARQDRTLAQQKADLAERDRRIEVLRKLPDDRLEKLFTVQRIGLGRYTAAADLDGTPGLDGIRVYLNCFDRDGHAVKAAGTIDVRLFDLSRSEKNLLAAKTIAPEAVGKHWREGMMGRHFVMECPWSSPPAGDKVTVSVTLTDYLTGKTFTAQKACNARADR